MRKINHFLAITVVAVLLLPGCAILYVPPAAQTPQFQQRGDFHGAIATGINGFDFQGAYAPLNGLGTWGSLSLQGGHNDHHHTYGEVAAGWFLPSSNALVLGVYGGIGLGSARGENTWIFNGSQQTEIAHGTYVRPFLQGNIGAHTDIVDVGLAFRAAHVTMKFEDNSTGSLPTTSSSNFLEPIFYLGIGPVPVKFTLQAGWSYLQDYRSDFDFQPFIFSLGVSVDLNLLKSNKED